MSSQASVVGYASRLTVRPGGRLDLRVGASGEETTYEADIVRVRCLDLQPGGAAFSEERMPSAIDGRHRASVQRVDRGSRGVVHLGEALAGLSAFSVQVAVWPTRPGQGLQALVGTWDDADRSGFALFLDERGSPALMLGDGRGRVARLVSERPLRPRQWVRISACYDARTGLARMLQEPRPVSVADRLGSIPHVQEETLAGIRCLEDESARLVFAAWREGRDARGPRYAAQFDGRLEAPRLASATLPEEVLARCTSPAPPQDLVDCAVGWWDFSQEPEGRRLVDRSRHGRHGHLENLPTRAVTGFDWDGSEHDWRRAPHQYGAIHFHSDDLYDAGWEDSVGLEIPADWRSGIYAARLRSEGGIDYVPFFVAPPKGAARAKLAFLVPTATYLAYANMPDPHAIVRRLGLDTSEGAAPADSLEDVIGADGEYGPSCYQTHADGSGVHHSSPLRPISNLRPRPDLWAFNADTLISDWLEASGFEYDVITDELLHSEGAELLEPYRAVVTGTHPEYASTAMLDALEGWLGEGGRLVYLGANGFYWRIAFSEAWPGAIELRRAEDGTRAWESRPGEYHHAWGGELGGLWRRIGRPPNHLVGIGFTAQGFGRSASYRRRPDASNSRAAFVFEGIDEKAIGGHGRLGGAAGEEIDRFDLRLGSPHHALVLATANAFGPEMIKTKEEFHAMMPPDPSDPDVRADLVFFETPHGGAVFSTGSIAWAGSLAHRGYDNEVSRITANVVRRFLDPEPFGSPV